MILKNIAFYKNFLENLRKHSSFHVDFSGNQYYSTDYQAEPFQHSKCVIVKLNTNPLGIRKGCKMIRMGCAQADITPDFKCFLRGYASRTDLTNKVEDPIEVGIIALEQENKRQLLITADSLGMAEEDCNMVRENIRQRFNIAPANVIIACSHSHFAPEMCGFTITSGGGMPLGRYPADSRFREFWLKRVMPAAARALDDLEEVELLQSDVKIGCIAYNRRTVCKANGMVTTNYIYPSDPENYDFSPIDDTMNIWKFMRGNCPKAILVRYGCHAVTGGRDHNAISADFPGAFRRAVLTKLGCPAFFMNGTAGDVVPMCRGTSSRQDIGEIMANAVKLADLTFRKTGDFQLKSLTGSVEATVPELLGKTAEDVENIYQTALAAAQGNLENDENLYLASRLYDMFQRWHGARGKLPLQIIQLGDKIMICLPFDVLTNIGEQIANIHPEAITVGYSGGEYGYIAMLSDVHKGGYETTIGSSLAPDTGQKFIDKAIELISQLKDNSL